MVKPEWGTKRTCPKCSTRFYDLGKDDPVTCINCSVNWYPEPVLKSKQPLPYEAQKTEKEVEKEDSDLAAEEHFSLLLGGRPLHLSEQMEELDLLNNHFIVLRSVRHKNLEIAEQSLVLSVRG